ncbi:MAG TPA: alpha/beta hydrolase [Vineibacter sp.]|nr:alpha/beta hydrolase [Vineibacter sp.]
MTDTGAAVRGHTFVLVHGAWHGGWCWRRVADRLRAAGHRVFTPTLTGLGERRHLMSSTITLDTFTEDVLNVIAMEDLADVVLVGHSFGGSPISGVADRVPERIRHLIYLDSLITQPGRTAFDSLPPDGVAARRKLAQESSGGLSLPPPAPDVFGIRDAADIAWVGRHLTPHPLGAYTSPLTIAGPIGNGLPCIYIGCIDPVYAALDGSRQWARQQKGFRYIDMAASHDAMVTHPEDLTRLLCALAGETGAR